MSIDPNLKSDVVVIGGGLAGLAASIHLAKGGLKVLCLEPVEHFDRIVGESLDWSAPELFAELGFEMNELVDAKIATYKRNVVLELQDGSRAEYIPSDWLAKPPFNVELRTLHLDRVRLHQELQKKAQENGVQFVRERAASIERTGKELDAIVTNSGRRYAAKWFIDASGSGSSFLGRQLELPYAEYGPRKVAMWAYASVEDWQEGTTLYVETPQGEYLRWVWEIPIAPGVTSVGFVTTGASVKEQRASGRSVDEIFQNQLGKFERFDPMLKNSNLRTPAVTAFSCRTYKGVCGLNWVIVGEAASVPDPITGNGVTSALRHATEAARLILRFLKRGRISWWGRRVYNLRVCQMGKFFNSLIEKLAYDRLLRDRFGLLKTGDLYIAIAWSANHLYSRIRPTGMLATLLFCGGLMTFRVITWAAEQIVRHVRPRAKLILHEAY